MRLGCRRGSAIDGGHIGDERADERARRIAAALARALIVEEEESQLAAGTDWAVKTAAEDVLLDYGPRRSAAFQEVVIRIKNRVAEKLVGIAVECVGPRL